MFPWVKIAFIGGTTLKYQSKVFITDRPPFSSQSGSGWEVDTKKLCRLLVFQVFYNTL